MLDPILRHGRSSALFVALKESPDTVFSSLYSDKVIKTILSHLQADKVIIILDIENNIYNMCLSFNIKCKIILFFQTYGRNNIHTRKYF